MKQRTGKECKKIECIRHDSYVKWQCGDENLSVCINCQWAYVSQFERKPQQKDIDRFTRIEENIKDLEPEFSKTVDENFWGLI